VVPVETVEILAHSLASRGPVMRLQAGDDPRQCGPAAALKRWGADARSGTWLPDQRLADEGRGQTPCTDAEFRPLLPTRGPTSSTQRRRERPCCWSLRARRGMPCPSRPRRWHRALTASRCAGTALASLTMLVLKLSIMASGVEDSQQTLVTVPVMSTRNLARRAAAAGRTSPGRRR
jgi:hypothetical protein